MDEQLVVVAATVIRVAPVGFIAPYVLATVRTGGRLSLVRVETEADTPPLPGAALHRVREKDGTQAYRLADE